MNSGNPALSVFVGIVVVAVLVYRQLQPRPLSARGLVVAPLIIMYFLLKAWPTFHPASGQVLEIALTSAITLVLGFLACREFNVYPDAVTGKAMLRGSWRYFMWWAAAVAIKIALSMAFGETSYRGANQVVILIPVLLLVATRSAYLYWRVTELGLALHSREEKAR